MAGGTKKSVLELAAKGTKKIKTYFTVLPRKERPSKRVRLDKPEPAGERVDTPPLTIKHEPETQSRPLQENDTNVPKPAASGSSTGKDDSHDRHDNDVDMEPAPKLKGKGKEKGPLITDQKPSEKKTHDVKMEVDNESIVLKKEEEESAAMPDRVEDFSTFFHAGVTEEAFIRKMEARGYSADKEMKEDEEENEAVKGQREERNEKRREDRQEYAREHPEEFLKKRQEAIDEAYDEIVDSWTQHFSSASNTERQRSAAVYNATTDEECARAAIRAFGQAQDFEDVSANLGKAHVLLFAALARNAMTFDATPFIANKTFILSKTGDPAPDATCWSYVRIIKTTRLEATESLLVYLQHFPADAPAVLHWLILLGMPFDELRTAFLQRMEMSGLERHASAFLNAVLADTATAELHGLHASGPWTVFVYVGITDTVVPAQRVEDDLQAEAAVRFINFFSVNPHLKCDVYRIPSLDVPVPPPMTMKTIPAVAKQERMLRAVIGAGALNSAPGGFGCFRLPSIDLAALRLHVRKLFPRISHPLSQEHDPGLTTGMHSLVDDELSLLCTEVLFDISEESITYMKTILADVLRLNHGRVVMLNIGKDVTRAALLDERDGFWKETTGQGPREDRRLLHLIDEDIPLEGDLHVDVLARKLGPYCDLWRLMRGGSHYKLHVLLLAQLIHRLNPLILSTRSNIVATIIRSLAIPTALEDVPAGFLEGKSPAGLVGTFPDQHPELLTEGDFTEAMGEIKIVQTGKLKDGGRLALHLAGADCGQFKYEPQLAASRWTLQYLVKLKGDALLHILGAHLQSNGPPSADGVEALAWFQAMLNDVNSVSEAAGLTRATKAAVKIVKSEEKALNALRAIIPTRTRHQQWLEQEELTARPRRKVVVIKSGRARLSQLYRILLREQRLHSLGLLPDPDHLSFWDCPILSFKWVDWAMKRAHGTDLVYAANNMGKTAEAAANSTANKDLLSERRLDHRDPELQKRTMAYIIEETSKAGDFHLSKKVELLARIYRCDTCGDKVTSHNRAFHSCGNDTKSLLVNGANFPVVERVLFPHEIANRPMAAAFGSKEQLLKQFGLRAHRVGEILSRSVNELQSALPHDYRDLVAAAQSTDMEVYVKIGHETGKAEEHRLLTMAVDALLDQFSRCPPEFELHHAQRSAWHKTMSKMDNLKKRLVIGSGNSYSVLTCSGSPDKPHLPYTFLCFRTQEKLIKGKIKYTGGKACAIRGCESRDHLSMHPVKGILDLPYHFSLRIWYSMQYDVRWPEKNATAEDGAEESGAMTADVKGKTKGKKPKEEDGD